MGEPFAVLWSSNQDPAAREMVGSLQKCRETASPFLWEGKRDAGYVSGFFVFADFVSAVLEQKETDVYLSAHNTEF